MYNDLNIMKLARENGNIYPNLKNINGIDIFEIISTTSLLKYKKILLVKNYLRSDR